MGSYNSFLDYYNGKINRNLFLFGLQFESIENFFNKIILQEYYSCNFNSQKLSSFFQILFNKQIDKKLLNSYRIKRVDLCYLNYGNIFIEDIEKFYSQFMVKIKAHEKAYYFASKKPFFLFPILDENKKRILFD